MKEDLPYSQVPENSRGQIFSASDKEITGSVKTDIDIQKISQESREISKNLARSRMVYEYYGNRIFIFEKDRSRWNSNEEKKLLACALIDALAKDQSKIARAIMMENAFEASIRLRHGSIQSQQEEIALRNGFRGKELDESSEFQEFLIEGPVKIPVSGVSVYDLGNKEIFSKHSVVDFFLAFNDVFKITRTGSLNNVDIPSSGLYGQFPEMTKRHIYTASSLMASLVNTYPQLRDDGMKSIAKLGNKQKELFGKYEILTENVAKIKNEIRRVLLDADDQRHNELKEALLSRSANRDESLIALFCVGIYADYELVKFYRQTKESFGNGKDADFFNLLSKSAKGILEEGLASGVTYIPNAEDAIEVIVENGKEKIDEELFFSQLRVDAVEIFQKTSVKEYEINADLINWQSIVKPDSLKVEFNSRPQKFSLKYAWENDLGENTRIKIDIDARNNFFDWNFLESPDDEEMVQVKKAMGISIMQVISQIKLEVDEQYRIKQEIKKGNKQNNAINIKREKPEVRDEIYELRKEARNEPVVAVEEPSVSSPSASLPGREIMIPDMEDLERVIYRLGTSDKESAMKQIEEFNKNGVGKFRMKKSTDREGRQLFTLSDRKVRILVREVEQAGNTRRFEIVDIGYRKDIYKRAGLNFKST